MKKAFKITLKQAKNLGKDIATKLKGGEILALVGPLGSGKTTFTKALAKSLKVKQPVLSPSFIIMQSFPVRLKNQKKAELFHLDLYRTKKFKETELLGLKEIWQTKNHITVIEWADKIRRHLPKNTFYFYFRHQ